MAPSTQTDANGKVVTVGNGVMLDGVVASINPATGVATITLSDAYNVAGVSVNVACYNIREQKLKV